MRNLLRTFVLGAAMCLSAAHAKEQEQDLTPQQERWVIEKLAALGDETRAIKVRDFRRRLLTHSELKDPTLRSRLTEAARGLGLNPAMFVVVGDLDHNLADFSGAFIYITPETLNSPVDRLQFAMAHEYGHVVLEHGIHRLKILFAAAATDCFTCVRHRNGFEVAVAYNEMYTKMSDAIQRKDEIKADAWAVRFLAERGIFPDYKNVFVLMHKDPECSDYDYGSHPSCKERLLRAYRILGEEYANQISKEELVRVVFSGAMDAGVYETDSPDAK